MSSVSDPSAVEAGRAAVIETLRGACKLVVVTHEHPDHTGLGRRPAFQHGRRGVGLGQPLHDTVSGAGARRHDHAVAAG